MLYRLTVMLDYCKRLSDENLKTKHAEMVISDKVQYIEIMKNNTRTENEAAVSLDGTA